MTYQLHGTYHDRHGNRIADDGDLTEWVTLVDRDDVPPAPGYWVWVRPEIGGCVLRTDGEPHPDSFGRGGESEGTLHHWLKSCNSPDAAQILHLSEASAREMADSAARRWPKSEISVVAVTVCQPTQFLQSPHFGAGQVVLRRRPCRHVGDGLRVEYSYHHNRRVLIAPKTMLERLSKRERNDLMASHRCDLICVDKMHYSPIAPEMDVEFSPQGFVKTLRGKVVL